MRHSIVWEYYWSYQISNLIKFSITKRGGPDIYLNVGHKDTFFILGLSIVFSRISVHSDANFLFFHPYFKTRKFWHFCWRWKSLRGQNGDSLKVMSYYLKLIRIYYSFFCINNLNVFWYKLWCNAYQVFNYM